MKYSLIVFCVFVGSGVRAQDMPPDSAIMEPINFLFTGMNRGDSAMVRRAFATKSIFATVATDKGGKTTVRYEELRDFLRAVGKPHTAPWSEPIWDISIQADGKLAQVWAKYAFYVGKKFSHCGVDAFQLFQDNDGRWKIFFIADTRQTIQCDVPAYISERFK